MVSQDLHKQYRIAQIACFAMIQAVFLYGVAAFFFLKGASALVAAPDLQWTRNIFYVVAISGFMVLPFIKQFIFSAQSAGHVGTKLFKAQMVAYAICESSAIFGIILAFVARNISEYYPFATIALVGMAIYWPKLQEWEEQRARENR